MRRAEKGAGSGIRPAAGKGFAFAGGRIMSFYIYFLLGFLGGIPAGMGMGGGTVTIPLLLLVGGVEQKIAQSANLFAFLPMSLPALRVHAQNGLLEKRGIFRIILPALLFSALGSLLAYVLPGEILRRAFGAFLLVLAVFQLRGVLGERAGKSG